MSVITKIRPPSIDAGYIKVSLRTLRVLPRGIPVVSNRKSSSDSRWWIPLAILAFFGGIAMAVFSSGQGRVFLHTAAVRAAFVDPEAAEPDPEAMRPPPSDVVVPVPVTPDLPNAPAQSASAPDMSVGIALPVPGKQMLDPDTPPTPAVAGAVKETKVDVPAAAADDAPASEKPLVTVKAGEPAIDPSLFDDAQAKIDAGDNAGALDIYNDILAKSRFNHTALAGKAFVLQRSGKFAEAVTAEKLLLQHYPSDKDAHDNLASALGALGTPEAIEELQRMIRRKPDFAAGEAALALAMANRGDGFHALPHARKATDIEPSNMLYQLDLAVVYDKMGHSEEAIDLYNQVLEAYKSNINVPAQPLPSSLSSINDRVIYLHKLISSVQDTDAATD